MSEESDRIVHTKTLKPERVSQILREYFKLPSETSVRFVVEGMYLDPSDWRGEYGPDYVCTRVELTWEGTDDKN